LLATAIEQLLALFWRQLPPALLQLLALFRRHLPKSLEVLPDPCLLFGLHLLVMLKLAPYEAALGRRQLLPAAEPPP
jgi:hypothetical protein